MSFDVSSCLLMRKSITGTGSSFSRQLGDCGLVGWLNIDERRI